MVVASWRKGTGFLYKDADPNAVASELRSLGDGFGPEDVVKYAKDGGTELHKCFEWDDSKAANSWRIYQARNLIINLVVDDKAIPEDLPPIRVFYKVDSDGGVSGYKETQKIIKVADEYANLLTQARNELRIFKAKYSCLEELADIMALID